MIRNFLVVLSIITFFSSCTKTTDRIIDKEADPVYDTITQASGPVVDYKINTSKDGIYANVDNTEGKITIYLPYFYQLEYMEPSISMASGFTISPGNDALVPVLSDKPFIYTVKDATGKSKEYSVNVVVQQPEMRLAEISTASNTRTLSLDGVYIYGQNMVPSFNVTSLHIINSNGEDVGLLVGNSQLDIPRSTLLVFSKFGGDISKLTANTDYWIEIRSYTLTKKMQYPVRFAI